MLSTCSAHHSFRGPVWYHDHDDQVLHPVILRPPLRNSTELRPPRPRFHGNHILLAGVCYLGDVSAVPSAGVQLGHNNTWRRLRRPKRCVYYRWVSKCWHRSSCDAVANAQHLEVTDAPVPAFWACGYFWHRSIVSPPLHNNLAFHYVPDFGNFC